MSFFGFHPLIERWFQTRFSEPTEPQRLGWPNIGEGDNTLIAAPTGSGKTLTAFLAVIDRLLKDSIDGKLEDGVRAIYVSPLRALSNDMHRNLSEPLEELNALATEEFPDVPIAALRVGLRTGDSTPSQRAARVRQIRQHSVHPPDRHLVRLRPRQRERSRHRLAYRSAPVRPPIASRGAARSRSSMPKLLHPTASPWASDRPVHRWPRWPQLLPTDR